MHNLPLVFFTVLAQAAAGLSLALCAIRLVSPKSATQYFIKGYIVTLMLLSVAGIASFGHLGRPMRVLNVLLGIKHGSPLSIEIIGVIMFGTCTVLALLSTLLPQRKWVTPASMLPAASGMIFVYVISNVYNLETVDAWHTVLTPLQFFVTALMLGFVAAWGLQPVEKKQQKTATLGIGIALAALIVIQPLMFMSYGELSSNALEDFIPPFPAARFIILALAVVLLFWAMRKGSAHRMLSYGIFGLLLISELLGRAYFYDLLNLRLL